MVPATYKHYVIKIKPTLVFVSKMLAYGRCYGIQSYDRFIGGPIT